MPQTYINNRYLLKNQLGAGGMGVIHLAHDRLTNQELALKQIHVPAEKLQFMSRAESEHVQDLQLALAREFQSLATLRHPNIISVIDYGFDQSKQPFFTMTYLSKAESVLEVGQSSTFDAKIKLVQQMFQALAYLHRRGVLHRDIKPDNLLVQDGHLRLLDFGLSLSESEEKLNSSGGTLAYWAPEQWLQQPYEAQSDIFAAGIVMFQLLTGQHPFGPTDSFLMDRVIDEEPNWNSLGDLTEFKMIFEKLLHKSPAARFQEPHEVLRALSIVLGESHANESDSIREGFIQAASFVGREAEIKQLSQALNQATVENKNVWLIGGESGVGKSRLLEEVRIKALVSGWQVFRGQAVETGGSNFHIWQELIRHLILGVELSDLEAGILNTIVPNLDQLLGQEIPKVPELEGSAGTRRLMLTIVGLLQRQKQPTLLLLEDLQWNHESLNPLQYLMRFQSQFRAPLVVLGSYRNDERPDLPQMINGASVLELKRLAEEDVAELSRAILGDRVVNRTELVSRLQSETEGNTFFLVEIIRTLALEAGSLANIENLTLPEKMLTGGIAKLIQRRLDRLAPKDHTLLHFAAAIGRTLDLPLLEQLTTEAGLPQLDLWLNRCQNEAILTLQENQWFFAHDKIRETILASLDQATLSPIYTQVAEGVEAIYPDDVTQAAALVHYWQMAGNREKEGHYAILAGKEAKKQFAHEDSVAFYLRALELIPTLSTAERFKISLDLEKAYYMQGKRELQASIISELGKMADSLGISETAESLSRRATYALAVGDLPTVQVLGETLKQIGDEHNSPAILIDAYHALSNVGLHSGRLKEVGDYANAGLELLKRSEANSGIDKGYFITLLAISADLRGEYERANQYNLELIEFAELTGDIYKTAVAKGNIGLTASMQGNYQLAYEMTKQTQKMFDEVGETFGAAAALINLAYIDLKLDKNRAPQSFVAALEMSQNINATAFVFEALVGAAEVYLNSGEIEKAAELVGLTRLPEHFNSDVEMRLKEFEPRLKQQVPADQWDILIEKGKSLTLEDAVAQYFLQFSLK